MARHVSAISGQVVDLPLSEAVSTLTLEIRVTGVNVVRARLWLGAQMMRLAAWIIGCNVEIAIDEAQPKNGFPVDPPAA